MNVSRWKPERFRSTSVRIHSARISVFRRWFGYGPYKPVMVGKMLDIFRVFYNFVEVGRDKQTPAMRLGLAKGKITVENIIYYR